MNKARLVAVAGVVVLAVALGVAVLVVSPRGGVGRPPASGESAPSISINTDPGPVFAGFIGDSYARGAGATSLANTWTSLVSVDRGWTQENVAASGAGYGSGATPYADQVAALPTHDYSFIVVSGGRIDMSSPRTYPAGITRTFRAIRSKYPNAQVIAVSPIWDFKAPSSDFAQLQKAVREGVEAVGGEYLDIGEPLAGHPEWVTPSNAPNDAGHTAIASAVEKSLSR